MQRDVVHALSYLLPEFCGRSVVGAFYNRFNDVAHALSSLHLDCGTSPGLAAGADIPTLY